MIISMPELCLFYEQYDTMEINYIKIVHNKTVQT